MKMANIIYRDIIYNKICASVLIPNKLRSYFYRLGGIRIHKGVNVCAHCFVGGPNLEIGEDTFVNYSCWFNTAAKITIGKKCNIANKVTFLTSTHEIGDINRRAGKHVPKEITVGDGTWIGANATILPGVNIGAGCIVAAGSVVVRDCEDNYLYGGNPAKKIKAIVETEEIYR